MLKYLLLHASPTSDATATSPLPSSAHQTREYMGISVVVEVRAYHLVDKRFLSLTFNAYEQTCH